jgi:hypothetical protein
MSASIITAIISGAVTVLSVLITSYFQNRKSNAIQATALDTHQLVNSNAQDAKNYQGQLTRALSDANIPIPTDASLGGKTE